MKQAIVVRKDLKMGAGKIGAQCAHASVSAMLEVHEEARKEWIESGMKKIVLKVASEKELTDLHKKAKAEKLAAVLIKDAGLTQLKKPTLTALGIGPADDRKIDKVTGKLKLL
ncbi:MAG TPA: peptidyl-tRNA hydrolase Pth2 [archaeon]|nr:peptidyl-tRNA hydrolase Pth2 [archaeon]